MATLLAMTARESLRKSTLAPNRLQTPLLVSGSVVSKNQTCPAVDCTPQLVLAPPASKLSKKTLDGPWPAGQSAGYWPPADPTHVAWVICTAATASATSWQSFVVIPAVPTRSEQLRLNAFAASVKDEPESR